MQTKERESGLDIMYISNAFVQPLWLGDVELDRDVLTRIDTELMVEDDAVVLLSGTRQLEVELVQAGVGEEGVFWHAYAADEVTTEATFTWEELLEDKPIEPH
jgi:hypothetical protein